MPDPVLAALEGVVAELPGGGEARAGQVEMAEAVRRAIAERKHVAVQAGTGTGKTLAYLVPGDPVGPHDRRGHGDQGPAGPARRARTSRSWPTTSTSRSPGRCSRAGPTTCACSASTRSPAAGDAGEQLALDGLAERAPAGDLLTPCRSGPQQTSTGDRAELDGRAHRGELGRRQRERPRVPGRGPLPERRDLLRRGGPPPGHGGRRRRRQPPPLRPRPRRRRRDPARARAGDHRRGPPARGHRLRHLAAWS